MRFPKLLLLCLTMAFHAFGQVPPITVNGAELKAAYRPDGPEWPVLAYLGRVQGMVQVRALIGTGGSVEAVEALAGPTCFRRAAENWVQRFQFMPALVQGRPVRVLSEFAVPFSLGKEFAKVPAVPLTQVVLKVDAYNAASEDVRSNIDWVRREALKRLSRLGLTPADPATADPASTLSLDLTLDTTDLGDGFQSHAIKARACRLAEVLKPHAVRFFRWATGERRTLASSLALEHDLDLLVETLVPERKLGPPLANLLLGVEVVPEGKDGVDAPEGKVVERSFRQLKVRKQPPLPIYPVGAALFRVQGMVYVEIVVDATGTPVTATILEGPVDLQDTALHYALSWTFEPALLDGKPMMARFLLTMPFHLR